MRKFKVIVEKHTDGFIAYPIGLKGIVVAEGDTPEEVIENLQSAIRFHIETFGEDVIAESTEAVDAFFAEVVA